VLNRQFALQADLILDIHPPTATPAGSDLTLQASVANNGPSPAPAVTLTAALPPGARFVSASPGCTLAAGTLTCQFGDLASAATASVLIVVNPDQPGTLDFAASVACATADPAPANNQASVPCQVTVAPEPVPALSPWGVAAGVASLCALLGRGRRGGASGRGA